MASKTLSFATVVALSLLLPAQLRADVPAPPPAPKPPPSPTPEPKPTPAPTPAPTPTDKPTDKPSEKPTAARGYIGFLPAPAAALSKKQKQHWHVTAETGVVGVNIAKGSPADAAGFHNGDVLLKYAGKDVPSTKDLDVTNPEKVQAFSIAFQALAIGVKEGEVVEIVVERDGKPVTLKATAIGMEAMKKVAAAAGEDEDGEDDEGDEGAEKGEKGEGKEKPAKAPEKAAPEKPTNPVSPPTPEKPAEPKKDDPK